MKGDLWICLEIHPVLTDWLEDDGAFRSWKPFRTKREADDYASQEDTNVIATFRWAAADIKKATT